MKQSDRNIVATSIVAFLAGVTTSIIGGIVWGSFFAIVTPIITGLGAAIIILASAETEP